MLIFWRAGQSNKIHIVVIINFFSKVLNLQVLYLLATFFFFYFQQSYLISHLLRGKKSEWN